MADTTNTEAAAATTEVKDPRYIAVTVSPEVLKAIRAKAGDKPLAAWIKTLISKELGIEIVAQKKAPTYATPELKKAAQKVQRDTKNDLIKRALEAYAKMEAEKEAAAKK